MANDDPFSADKGDNITVSENLEAVFEAMNVAGPTPFAVTTRGTVATAAGGAPSFDRLIAR